MAIIPQELKLYKSRYVNNTVTNGGRMSGIEIPQNVKNGIFPDVSQMERDQGAVIWRKVFYKIANVDNMALQDAKVFIDIVSPGSGRVAMYRGTQRDSQGDIVANSGKAYGPALLTIDATAGDTQITVQAESGTNDVFHDACVIYIADANGDEFISASTVSWSGDVATINLASGLMNNYSAAGPCRVASCITADDITTSWDIWSLTSANGQYDTTANPPLLDNIGTVEQTWTLTFTSSTDFNISGDTVGALGTGNLSTDLEPANPDFSRPYFTLRSAGYSGSFVAGDSIIFQTHPAAMPLWLKEIIPAGAAAGNEETIIAIAGESA